MADSGCGSLSQLQSLCLRNDLDGWHIVPGIGALSQTRLHSRQTHSSMAFLDEMGCVRQILSVILYITFWPIAFSSQGNPSGKTAIKVKPNAR